MRLAVNHPRTGLGSVRPPTYSHQHSCSNQEHIAYTGHKSPNLGSYLCSRSLEVEPLFSKPICILRGASPAARRHCSSDEGGGYGLGSWNGSIITLCSLGQRVSWTEFRPRSHANPKTQNSPISSSLPSLPRGGKMTATATHLYDITIHFGKGRSPSPAPAPCAASSFRSSQTQFQPRMLRLRPLFLSSRSFTACRCSKHIGREKILFLSS